jgi:class 3 adenylate cyclase
MWSLSAGFTTMSQEIQPEQVMQFLNELFSKFDELVAKHKVSKVGDNRQSVCVQDGPVSACKAGALGVR